MYAVIKSGGRQYKVAPGETLEVNRLPVEDGAQVIFNEVLLISDANGSRVGTPVIDNAMVLATADRQARGKKLIVFRYKPKKRFRHRRGHRQELTVLTIDDIIADGKSLITGEAPKLKDEMPVEEEIITPVEFVEVEPPVSESLEAEIEDNTTTRRRRRREDEQTGEINPTPTTEAEGE
jgi:large subunit ribosomal protein L21